MLADQGCLIDVYQKLTQIAANLKSLAAHRSTRHVAVCEAFIHGDTSASRLVDRLGAKASPILERADLYDQRLQV